MKQQKIVLMSPHHLYGCIHNLPDLNRNGSVFLLAVIVICVNICYEVEDGVYLSYIYNIYTYEQ